MKKISFRGANALNNIPARGNNNIDAKVRKGAFCEKMRNAVVKFMLDRIALILSIIGGINWGAVGLFKFDIVAWICGGQNSVAARIIYTIVGLASIWCISLLFRESNESIADYSRD